MENSAKQNLENLSKSLMSLGSGIEAETSFSSFQAAMEYAFALAETIRKYEGGDPGVQEIYDAMMEYNLEEAQLRNGEGHA